jgi:hypothetical protein
MTNAIAYGFAGKSHLASERVTTIGVGETWSMIMESNTEHNRIVNGLLQSLVTPTTDFKERAYLPTGGTLQPGDEWSVPLPVRPEGYYDVAYPLFTGMTAWGANRISSQLMIIEEANRFTLMVESQDMDWVRRHVQSSLLYPSSWTFGDPQHGNLTIMPLANNDTVTYNKRGTVTPAVDNHYLAQADDIDATHDPFPTIYAELAEHVANMGPYVCYVASDLVSDIEAMTDLLPPSDSAVTYGNSTDRISLTDEFAANIIGFGTEVIGRKNKMYIVEWPSLPSGIILAIAQGAMEPVLKMRQYPVAALQGLYTKMSEPTPSLEKFNFWRDCGFGVYNRVGAVVYQIGEATYAVPSEYAAMPLAI